MQLVAALCVCSCLFLASSSQEVTDTGTPPGTTDDSTTQGIDWDATSTRDSRRGRYSTPRATPDYTTLFENQWGPAMMNHVSAQPYGTRLQSPGPREVKEILDFFPFLRRPDLVTVNVTRSSDDYPHISDAIRQVRRPGLPPYHPGLFYPRPDMAEILRYTVEADPVGRPSSLEEGEEKQNISASSPAPFFMGAPSGRFEGAPGQYPYPMFGFPPPDYFYRRGGDRDFAYPYAIPPQFYPPPPPVPRNEDGSPAYPELDAFDRSPYIDRESGPETAESILPIKEEAASVPIVAEPVNAILPPIVPRQPLPLPPFPFGLLPPGPAPPFPLPGRFLPPTVPPPTFPPAPEDALLSGALSGEPVAPPEGLPSNPPLPPPVLPLQEGEIAKADGVSPPIIPSPEATPEVRIPYEFGYDMNDGRGTDQHRQEMSDGSGSVTGSYGYRDARGVYRVVNYIADKNGFRAFIKSNEPGVANPGSADVVVMAEVPPPATIAEGLKQPRLEAVEVPDVPIDLIPVPSDIK